MSRTYDKLVRDDVPAVIRENGERPVTHVADDDEFERRLREKLVEEAEEFREDGTVDELADVLAVFETICERAEVTLDDLREREREKAANRGGFDEGIVLERVEEEVID